LITTDDLAKWRVYIEEPVVTDYKGIAVHKLTTWVQGPVLLQTLNILEDFDLRGMGYNSPEYIHTLYQAMNLAYADRDFYYGDPYYPPEEPVRGLLSKEYAQARALQIHGDANNPDISPGDPYPFQGETNPYRELLARLNRRDATPDASDRAERAFHSGTTSVIAADAEGWVVSVTPSGGWIPAVIAGRTGIGLSQRMQSFVLNSDENPFNVVEPGKRPRATLTPSLALKDGKPYLAFAVEGGDAQDQYLLQFFLNVVEFGMTVQEAAEAPSFVSYQMHSSFDQHDIQPGKILVNESLPESVRERLAHMGYTLTYAERTSGPVNAIQIDARHGTFWGGSSHHGEDHGIAW
jgi:gamma-glutamyltranspeptidase/glutathione hydrolase